MIAPCGSVHCAGCYDVGDGRKIHPPTVDPKYLARGGGKPAPKTKRGKKKKELPPDTDGMFKAIDNLK